MTLTCFIKHRGFNHHWTFYDIQIPHIRITIVYEKVQ